MTSEVKVDAFHVYESIVYGGASAEKLVEVYGVTLQKANAIYNMDTSKHTSFEDDLSGINKILSEETK